MIEIKHILNLNNFSGLDESALIEIAESAKVNEHKKNQRLLVDDLKDSVVYLLDGELGIKGEHGVNLSIVSGTERAQHPIFRVNTPGLYVSCLTSCKVLCIDRSFIEKYDIDRGAVNESDVGVEEFDSLSTAEMAAPFVTEVIEAYKGNKVKIPSLPEIALNINSAVEDSNISVKQLSGLIQTDPAIAARILQVSNSAIYGGGPKIDSIKNAITRMGLEAVRAVVICIVMRDLFTPKNVLIKKCMATFYEQSIRVGVICYELAKHIKGLEPEHGFLVGLLHDIGTIPILVIADQHPELSRQAGHLDSTISLMKGHIGSLMLTQWAFDDEYAYIAKHAYDWQREVDKADYCDLVQVAILHAQFVGGPKYDAPNMSEVSAFKRLGMDNINLDEEIYLLNEVSGRIKEMIKKLCN